MKRNRDKGWKAAYRKQGIGGLMKYQLGWFLAKMEGK